MKILLISFLPIIFPPICAGWTYTQDSETFKQELIREYPILAGNGETVSFEDIQDRKTRIHQISAKIKAMDSLVMLPYDENLLNTADQVTEQIPESFDIALYAASLYDILRAYCFDDSVHPDSSYTKLYNLFKELAENLYNLAFGLAKTTEQTAVSAACLAEIRIRDRYYGYDIMPLYRECYDAATIPNYKIGILERMIGYLSDYQSPIPEERIKTVLPYKKMLAELVYTTDGLTPDYKANIISDCARYCVLAHDDDAGYYFNKAAELEGSSSLPQTLKQLGKIINGKEFETDPTVHFALTCDDYNTAINAMNSLGMILNENNFYTLEDIYHENGSNSVRFYQFSEAYPAYIRTLARIKSRFGKEDADRYKTEAFLSGARIIQYDLSSKSPETIEKQLRILTPSLILQYSNSDPRLAFDAALFTKHLLSGVYHRLYRYTDIQSSLSDNEYAIEFVNYYDDRTGIERYDALILNNNCPCPIRVGICEGQELSELQASGQKMYLNGLYGLVWSKLEQYLPEDAKLLFAPSGLLNIINIEAAQDEKGTRASDIWEIHRLTSTKQICLPQTVEKPFSNAVLFGKSDGLRYTEQEVNETAYLLRSKGIHTDLFTAEKCTELNLIACADNVPDILHIASHAFFLDNDTIPSSLQSGLILSNGGKAILGKTIPGDNTDNIVFSNEIAKIPLEGCSLVVLSACETGLGYISAEGVSGLQDAFKKAGVQTIVMSLWEVNDMTTSKLMTAFYRNLLSGMDAHSAMYNAQDSLRLADDFSHPYYWAGFIVVD